MLSFTEDNVQFGWDSTSIKIAQECLRKYQLVLLEGWTPHRRSVHLDFGGWYASALEAYHGHRARGMSIDDALAEVVAETLVESWVFPECDACEGTGVRAMDGSDLDDAKCEACEGTGKHDEGGEPWTSDHNTKTRENLIRTIVWYVEQFRDDPCTTIILGDGKPAVEHSFKLEADNGIILSGHLDRLVEYGDKPYIQDQKTTGSTLSSNYFKQYDTDTQMSLYSFAGRSLFGLPIKGVIIDAAQIAVGFTRFERGFTFRSEDQLNEWYDVAMWHIEQARRATVENYFPMNTSSCNNYGGCQFRHICAKSPSVRQQFLKGDFVQGKRWDPLVAR